MILIPKAQQGIGTSQEASLLAAKHGWFFTQQFEAQANADKHEKMMGREMVNDVEGCRPDCMVTGYGTDGIVKSVSRVLIRKRPYC